MKKINELDEEKRKKIKISILIISIIFWSVVNCLFFYKLTLNVMLDDLLADHLNDYNLFDLRAAWPIAVQYLLMMSFVLNIVSIFLKLKILGHRDGVNLPFGGFFFEKGLFRSLLIGFVIVIVLGYLSYLFSFIFFFSFYVVALFLSFIVFCLCLLHGVFNEIETDISEMF